jgi:hypothetical protein
MVRRSAIVATVLPLLVLGSVGRAAGQTPEAVGLATMERNCLSDLPGFGALAERAKAEGWIVAPPPEGQDRAWTVKEGDAEFSIGVGRREEGDTVVSACSLTSPAMNFDFLVRTLDTRKDLVSSGIDYDRGYRSQTYRRTDGAPASILVEELPPWSGGTRITVLASIDHVMN